MKCKNRIATHSLGMAALALATSISLSARADYPATVLSQGPVGYWQLNESTAPQLIGGATNIGSLGASAIGIYSNTPTRGLAGPFAGSKSVGLDGVSQSINTPWVAGLNTTDFSVELWANPSVVPNFAYLAASVETASPRSGWYLAQDTGATFGLGSAFVVRMFNQNGTTPSVTLGAPVSVAGVWYHIVLTYDGSTASLYTNGVLAQSVAGVAYVPNVSFPFTIGERSDHAFNWPGQVAEPAIYGGALSPARVAAHYTAATTAPATYAATVLADAPLLYDRLQEAPSPVAVNTGSLGAAANGLYYYHALPNQPGPRPASSPTPFPGFSAGNTAVTFDGAVGSVTIPPLQLNTNTVTITAWVKPNGAQAPSAGIFSTADGAGIQFDVQNVGGFELAYNWNNDPADNNETFLTIPDGQWSFVALTIRPDHAVLFVPGQTPFTNTITHAVIPFSGQSFIGETNGANVFNGTLDEVAIFNRALGLGEVYTEYAEAVGGLPPQVFSDPQGPVDVIVGDTLTLSADVGGTPNLSYQWRKDSIPVPGGTTNPLVKPGVVLGDAGSYDVVVTNLYGSVTTGVAVVTTEIATFPVIVKAPVSRTLYQGATLNLAVVATGGGLKYQWQRSATNLPGATTSSYIVPSVLTSNAGSYSLIVSNSLGLTNVGPVVITIPNVSTSSYEGLIIASAPEAWWRLDEAAGSTNLYDSMGRHDGYYTNVNGFVPPVVLGVPGALAADSDTAASFSGNGGVGVIPYTASLNPNILTYEGWALTTDVVDFLVPFSSSFAGNGVYWGTAPSGDWSPYNGGYYPFNTPISSGIWTHLVISYDGTRVISGTHYPWSFYINGVTDGFVWTGSTQNGGGPFIIGGHGVDATTLADTFFSGSVDEVAVYNRVLSAAEITAHLQGRFGTSTAPYFIGGFLPQTVTPGKSLTYTTTVQGSVPITLQWYKNGAPIPGATSNTLTFASTLVTDTGLYTLWATNGVGTASQSVTVTVIPPVSYANVTNGLVLHLKFDGDTTDSSGRGNNGTQVGSPAFVPGLIGTKALQYDTVTVTNGTTVSFVSADYVTLGAPADLQFGAGTSFTISTWIKLPAGDLHGDLPFIGTATNSNNNFGWDLSPSYQAGGWQWSLDDGTNVVDVNGPGNSINDGNWHHFLLTIDRPGHTASTYLDGVLTGTRDLTSLGSIDTGGPVVIGQDPTGTYPEAGVVSLDDLGIWRRVLTPLEVAKIQSAGVTGGRSFDTVAPPVKITVTQTATNLTISWATGTLLQSDTLGAGAVWTPVPGATAPSLTIAPSGAKKFYRVLLQ